MTTLDIYTLSLHDALPICKRVFIACIRCGRSYIFPSIATTPVPGRLTKAWTICCADDIVFAQQIVQALDRKSTRLNSSHRCISYAVFCLKKKKKTRQTKQL